MSKKKKSKTPPSPGWRSHEQVRAHLGIARKTLRKKMNDTPKHIKKPWVNYGSPEKPKYHWEGIKAVDSWWKEVCRWHISEEEAKHIKSAGESLMAAGATVRARPKELPKPSDEKSKRLSAEDADGNLVTFTRKLALKKSSRNT